jgi:hypothetical protein
MLTLSAIAAPLHAQTPRAQPRAAAADICIAIDDAHDTLSPQDRTAAIVLLGREFELAGWRVVSERCANQYTVSHIRLGNTIVVTLSGANENREGTALGLDDLPALYSQMVRSIVTGRPMTGFNVVDRTNVTASQTSPQRVRSDSERYARLGYGSVFGDRSYGTPALGFGYRVELDSFGVDVSFLNLQIRTNNSDSSNGAVAGSWLKLEGLYFLRPKANATAYVGGGLSWGGTNFGGGSANDDRLASYRTNWHGSGLQGELTIGYEIPRASTLRVFVQADGVLPFYKVTSEAYSYSRSGRTTTTTVTTDRRYAPSVVVSVGLGWQRNRGARP